MSAHAEPVENPDIEDALLCDGCCNETCGEDLELYRDRWLCPACVAAESERLRDEAAEYRGYEIDDGRAS